MKKFFSAILLMTMMVFSVGTFVSCNDLVEEVETIKGQTSDIESTIKGLETQIAALETALKAEIKSAADQAKADAIKEAKAECEVLKAAFEQALAGKADTKALEELAALVEAKIAAIEPELAKMATKVELEDAVKELVATDTQLATQIAALEAYKATADTAFAEVEAAIKAAEEAQAELKAIVEENYTELYDLIGKNASYIASCIEDIDELKTGLAGYMETTDANIDEITGYLNSAIEDLDLLNGKVEKLEADLKTVTDKVAELAEKVEKIDADLKVIDAVLEGLLNQIQSVVKVPSVTWAYDYTTRTYVATGLSEDVYVDGYTFGDDFNTFRFLVEYEISPKSLVSKLAEADVDVYFTNVVAKGEEPARYEAEIAAVDAEKGRVTVRGIISDKKSAAFKYFADEDGAAAAVAVALHIDEPTVDGGTYVADEYFELNRRIDATTGDVILTDITDLVYLYDTETGKVIAAYDYEKPINVPFTTKVEASSRSFFPINLLVNIENNWYTLDSAAKYFGLSSLAAEYTVDDFVAAEVQNGHKLADYITLSGKKTMDAAAAFKKAPTKDQIGMQAAATISKIKVGGEETLLTVTSTYKITEGRASDITIDPVSLTWSYKYGQMYRPSADFELSVDTPVDLTKLTYSTTYGSVTYTDNFNDMITVTMYPYSKTTGMPVLNVDGTNYAATATVYMTALSSKAVKVHKYDTVEWDTFTNIPFLTEDVVWVASFTLTDPTTKINYDASFVVNTTAMPTNKEIDLGTITTTGYDVNPLYIPVAPIKAIMAKDGNFYTDLTDDLFKYDANTKTATGYDFGAAAHRAGDGNSTLVEGGNTYEISLNFYQWANGERYAYNIQNGQKVESAYIYIPAEMSGYDKKYDLVYSYEFCGGITYTFKAKVELTKPTVKLVANPKFVLADGTVPMVGTFNLPAYVSGNYNPQPYALNAINLREYVNLDGADKADEYKITYKVTTAYKDAFGQDVKDDAIATIYGTASLADDWSMTAATSNVDLNWVDTSLNAIEVEIQLVSAANTDVKFGDPVKVKLVIPELINVKAEAKTTDYKNDAGISSLSVAQSIVITEALTGKNQKVYNVNATDWTNYFAYKHTSLSTLADPDYADDIDEDAYDLFGVDFEVKEDQIKANLANGVALTANDFDWDPATLTVSIDRNNGALSQDVIVTVPVTVKHIYQGGHPHNVEVKFTFKK